MSGVTIFLSQIMRKISLHDFHFYDVHFYDYDHDDIEGEGRKSWHLAEGVMVMMMMMMMRMMMMMMMMMVMMMMMMMRTILNNDLQEMGAHLVAHGDGVKDVSFAVEDLEGIMIQCKKKGV